MTDKEDFLNVLKDFVNTYQNTIQGKWLNDINWQSIPVTFVKKLPWKIAGFYFLRWIVLLRADVSSIFPLYVHELRHRWQWKKSPMKYLVGKLYRPLLENDADIEEKKADDWFCDYVDKGRM